MASGARPFDSGHTQEFLRLLLKTPDVADETLSAEQYNRLLVQTQGDVTSLASAGRRRHHV